MRLPDYLIDRLDTMVKERRGCSADDLCFLLTAYKSLLANDRSNEQWHIDAWSQAWKTD